ncbi:MAG: sulfotransferase [Mesorhizobium sp.]|nr:MAG: sulfotransferase [Mesorhizobium sp.]
MFDKAEMLHRAALLAGLTDYGEPSFEEALERLLYSAQHEAGLNATGIDIFHDEVIRLLSNRLVLVNEWKTNPTLADEDIERPLFILGLPRSGTSILHELLAQDIENRVPLTWETTRLTAGSGHEPQREEETISQTENEFLQIDKIIPDFKKIHRIGALFPDECVAFMNNDFKSMHFHVCYKLPKFQKWLDRSSFADVYRSHKQQLQRLQSRKRGVQWVLKSPQHLWKLDALLEVYPDAHLVQLHRDPVDSVASYASLVHSLRRAVSDVQDPREIGHEWAEYFALGLAKTMDLRNKLEGRNPFLDIPYREFMDDPVRMIGLIYTHCGRTLSTAAAERMKDYMKSHPADMFGKHRYKLTDFGLDLDEERERFQSYRQEFIVN